MPNNPIVRDQKWLEECFQHLLQNHFPDLPQGFPIRVCFGSPTKNRFGSISARNQSCLIRPRTELEAETSGVK